MAILRDTQLQRGGPPNSSQFSSDSVLGRMARGSYEPTDADLEELHRLAQSGNRAERRAASKHLKKLGIAAPPRAPVVIPVVAPSALGERAATEPIAPTQAQAMKQRPAKKPAAKQSQASKQSPLPKAPQQKAAPKEAIANTASPKKTTAKKAAAKKAAPGKRAPGKAATKNPAVKKTAMNKASAKKAPAKTPRSK